MMTRSSGWTVAPRISMPLPETGFGKGCSPSPNTIWAADLRVSEAAIVAMSIVRIGALRSGL